MSERHLTLAESTAGSGGPDIHVGVLLALSPKADEAKYRAFVRRLAGDVLPALERSAPARWTLHYEEPTHLADDAVRRPSDFLDDASLRMVEGPFDLVVVVTDVGVMSRKHEVHAGLASEIAQIAVLSTRKLLITPRGQPVRSLECGSVRWNGATLLLHLLGHLMGLGHDRGGEGVMRPFRFVEARRGVPAFDPHCEACLRRRLARLPEREHAGGGWLRSAAFHLSSAARNPGQVLRPLWRNRAPFSFLLSSSPQPPHRRHAPHLHPDLHRGDLGRGAAHAPLRGLVVRGGHRGGGHLVPHRGPEPLFFPRKEKRVITEHMAVVNTSTLLTMFLAMVGLLAMTMLLILFVELYIFPEQLIYSWPTLELNKAPGLVDRVQMAAFIGTITVLTKGLAGGLESRAVIRHLALFEDEP